MCQCFQPPAISERLQAILLFANTCTLKKRFLVKNPFFTVLVAIFVLGRSVSVLWTSSHISSGESCCRLFQGLSHKVRPFREAERHARDVGSVHDRLDCSGLDLLRFEVISLFKVRSFPTIQRTVVARPT